MIKSITVTNYLGKSVKIVLAESDPEHGMIIESVDGLGPPRANINLTKLSGMDGSVFNSANVENRNIVIHMLFTFAPTIEDSRQRTYEYFPVKKPVTLLIKTDNREAEIKGVVESNEPEIFSETTSNSISIICPEPYLYSLSQNIATDAGIKKTFTFPFSNRSIINGGFQTYDKLIIMGKFDAGQGYITTVYDGDSDVGFIMTIGTLRSFQEVISIHNLDTREVMKISISKIRDILNNLGYSPVTLEKGTEIIINTNLGNKKIELLKNGDRINILNALDKDSDWFKIKKGINKFMISEGADTPYLLFKIENKILYEGI